MHHPQRDKARKGDSDDEFDNPLPASSLGEDEFDRAVRTSLAAPKINPGVWMPDGDPEMSGSLGSQSARGSPKRASMESMGYSMDDRVEVGYSRDTFSSSMRGSNSYYRPRSAGPTGRSYGYSSYQSTAMASDVLAANKAPAKPAVQAASTEQRMQAEMKRILHAPPQGWSVSDVCKWVEFHGLPQHRMKFAHHRINGKLLLRLTDEHLKVDLGILALGHRSHLLEGVTALAAGQGAEVFKTTYGEAAAEGSGKENEENVRSSGKASGSSTPGREKLKEGGYDVPASLKVAEKKRPLSAPRERAQMLAKGGAVGRLTVVEQQKKLEREAEQARKRLQMLKVQEAQTRNNRRAAEEEMRRVAGQLQAVEKALKGKKKGPDPLDPDAPIPWHATGYHIDDAQQYRDYAATEFTFKPQLNKNSMHMMGQGEDSSFLARVDDDIKARTTKIKEKQRFYERLSKGGADMEAARRKREEEFLKAALEEKIGQRIPSLDDNMIESLIEANDAHTFGFSSKQWAHLERLCKHKERAVLAQDVEDCFNPKDKQAAKEALNRFDKEVRRARRAFMGNTFRANDFLSRTASNISSSKARMAETVSHLEATRAFGRPAEDQRSEDLRRADAFFRERLGWWGAKDDALDKDIKAARLKQTKEGDEDAKRLMGERDATYMQRLQTLLALSLDERALQDGTKQRRETSGAELGALAMTCGVPRFVPSVKKRYFREMADLGLDESVHLLATMAPDRLLGLSKVKDPTKLPRLVYKALKQQLFVHVMARDSALREMRHEELYNMTPHMLIDTPGELGYSPAADALKPTPDINNFMTRTEEDLKKRREKEVENQTLAPPADPKWLQEDFRYTHH